MSEKLAFLTDRLKATGRRSPITELTLGPDTARHEAVSAGRHAPPCPSEWLQLRPPCLRAQTLGPVACDSSENPAIGQGMLKCAPQEWIVQRSNERFSHY